MRADLEGALLSGAHLDGATMSGARLADANLSFARLHGAKLGDTYYGGDAVLSPTTTLDSVQYDEATTWPKDFAPPVSNGKNGGTPSTTSSD
jgi:uncharacterized protein YjbI with pentapeptide repeats